MAKAETKAEKPKNCPECNGPAYGRGYAHAAGCSKALFRTTKETRSTGPKRRTKQPDPLMLTFVKLPTLLRFEAAVAENLKRFDKAEVKKAREALANLEKLRKQLADAEALLA